MAPEGSLRNNQQRYHYRLFRCKNSQQGQIYQKGVIRKYVFSSGFKAVLGQYELLTDPNTP